MRLFHFHKWAASEWTTVLSFNPVTKEWDHTGFCRYLECTKCGARKIEKVGL